MRLPAQVALARDPARILLWLGVRLVIAEIGIAVGLQAPGTIGLAVTLAGGAVLAYVILLTFHVLSLRIQVHPGEVLLWSVIVRRRYRLAPGIITRMKAMPGRAAFGTQLGAFGIEIGLGRATAGESVNVVRLAAVKTMIIIPVVGTRLALAPSSERILLRALRAAAEQAGIPLVADVQASGARAPR